MDTSHWTLKAPTISMVQNMTYKIHVLLVDHDSNTHAPIIDMFEYFSYKVTIVKLASTALSILSEGKPKFDLLIENINLPDACGFKLLQDAVQMDLPVILLLDEDDVELTKKALEDGALLCIKKPVSMEIAKYLWQHVLKEKIRRLNRNEQHRKLMASNILHNEVGEEDLVRGYLNDNISSDDNYKSNKKIRRQKIANQDKENSLEHQDIVRFKRKVWTEWTQELHEKFMDAVRKLGEGRCYPKDILELMNVPGLTRMQVASHLQKCRCGTWQPPNERKSKIATPKTTSRENSSPAKSKRFGSMPHLGCNSQLQWNIQENHENSQDLSFVMYSSVRNNVLGYNREEFSQEEYIEPHDSNGYNPFSDVGIETLNTGHVGLTLGTDDTFMSDEQFVIDAQSVTLSTNTSLDQRNTTEQYFEFPNMDNMIQDFYAFEQEPINYSGSSHALDLNPTYSNQVPVMRDTNMDQWEETSNPYNERETQDWKMEE